MNVSDIFEEIVPKCSEEAEPPADPEIVDSTQTNPSDDNSKETPDDAPTNPELFDTLMDTSDQTPVEKDDNNDKLDSTSAPLSCQTPEDNTIPEVIESDNLDSCDKLEDEANKIGEMTADVIKEIEKINEKMDIDNPDESTVIEEENKDANTSEESEKTFEEEEPKDDTVHEESQDKQSEDEADKTVENEEPREEYEYVGLDEQPVLDKSNTEDKDNENAEGNTENEDDEQRDNPLFVNIDKEDNDKETNNKDELLEEDPIASDGFIPENQEGADEELCIIPDTERVISQEEKEAAFSIPPLRDISEASSSNEVPEDGATPEPPAASTDASSSTNKFKISKCSNEELQTCLQCVLKRKVKYTVTKDDDVQYICHDTCLDNFKVDNANNYVLTWEGEIRVKDLATNREPPKLSFERKCVVCKKKTDDEENNLTWEIMDFCNEFCLSKYQKEIGSSCASCNAEVRPNSLGKYCVRFGNDIRQFCSSHCLEEYKKGLKVCSYCQQDMSTETDGFLAPVGDKGQFKDFCSQKCMEKYDIMTNNRPPTVDEGTKCSVCKTDNPITIEYETDGAPNYFCSDRCFVAFSFVNNIAPGKCSMCRRYFPNEILEKNTMFYDNVQYSFCSNSCQNIYIIAHRKIVPCAWCKVKKYNFDMIRRYFKTGPVLNMCSINCLSLFQVSVNAVHSKKTLCNFCNKRHQPMYHLTMSDATIRNFCSYSCVMSFQNKFKKSPITLNTEDLSYPVPAAKPVSPPLPVISSVQSLAASLATKNGNYTGNRDNKRAKTNSNQQHILNSNVEPPVKVKHHIIIKSSPTPDQRNVATMCKLRQHHKSTSIKPNMTDKAMQTDQREAEKVLIPVPIPVYIPSPLPMYSVPAPYPLPFPLPIPVPIFIPTTRNSAKGIMKEIKKIQVKIPTDPYEAELLMMAEMVAGDKKEENTDSESDVDEAGPGDEGTFSPEPVDASNTFGDDMLQMALKMATELEEPAVDLEGALTANTITAPQGSETTTEETVDDAQPILQINERQSFRGRKRGGRGGKGGSGAKRRRMSQPAEIPVIPPQPVAPPEPAEKPDAHLCLKYTFGVNAWKQWVTTKNTELEKSTKYAKPFKTEILQLTADELNYSLCLFVKEVRKPNGAEYAPDTIYYLCLGIQQYLFENGRIDNIFCDPYYEQFTDSLDEVARKFSVLYNDSHYIVTRVEEEHLWESKQLGAHSPHVLLSTLMFFNTKHFNLTSVQEHMQLSFSHIMKHWKRNPNQPGVTRVPGSRNVLLRFYPPQTAIQNNTRKKKVYEQQENDENPLRCPVKLYEFYLSKCPESVKTRNDVFYLQPERSCVPDSPVWYSTTALPQEALEKMLHRVKMVKEINVALLTS
ncbi:zinc finger MYM-type protein 3 isoform X2 [Tribolium castaneum]|uniref:zinc finger MYM-type protein 3 isoform X2 n=1 Tax=Tribolium castaneum TaxID=7070 RepID=UPI0000D57767|nr:PREDICTED: zinc finger MYM-type protein 3 isoform X2 [Tribolium castaneum]|eukprot:XP_008200258.1 PREDICTED: zinc finger MYM-type protein 3 isoform X2 [Tribolium castaneum]